jgi:hypothetical protein
MSSRKQEEFPSSEWGVDKHSRKFRWVVSEKGEFLRVQKEGVWSGEKKKWILTSITWGACISEECVRCDKFPHCGEKCKKCKSCKKWPKCHIPPGGTSSNPSSKISSTRIESLRGESPKETSEKDSSEMTKPQKKRDKDRKDHKNHKDTGIHKSQKDRDENKDDWDDKRSERSQDGRECESPSCKHSHRKCCKGPRGHQGPRGPTGAVGRPGFNGQQGPTGPVGEGEQGPTGPAGQDGQLGPFGPTGPQGVQGIQGVPGQGQIGPTGPQGVQGIQGIQGNEGPTGPTGPAGIQGPVGVTGPTGPNVSSLIPFACGTPIPVSMGGTGVFISFGSSSQSFDTAAFAVPHAGNVQNLQVIMKFPPTFSLVGTLAISANVYRQSIPSTNPPAPIISTTPVTFTGAGPAPQTFTSVGPLSFNVPNSVSVNEGDLIALNLAVDTSQVTFMECFSITTNGGLMYTSS